MKAVVATFNQEKALGRALSVIVQLQTSRRFVSSSTADWGDQLPPDDPGQGQQQPGDVTRDQAQAADSSRDNHHPSDDIIDSFSHFLFTLALILAINSPFLMSTQTLRLAWGVVC